MFKFIRKIFRARGTERDRINLQANSEGMQITIESGWDVISTQVPRQEVDKLLGWMNQTFGGASTNDTKSRRKLSLCRTPSDTTGNTPYS